MPDQKRTSSKSSKSKDKIDPASKINANSNPSTQRVYSANEVAALPGFDLYGNPDKEKAVSTDMKKEDPTQRLIRLSKAARMFGPGSRNLRK